MPDESAVIYRQDLPDGSQAITAFDRVSKTRRTLVAGRGLREAALSPDGALIAFTARQNGIRSRIFVARLNPSGPVTAGLQPARDLGEIRRASRRWRIDYFVRPEKSSGRRL
jgi:Tol biopolymer transport system component